MGGALLKGWLAGRLGPVWVVEPNPSAELRRLAGSKRITIYARIEEIKPALVGVCVVAIKPQILRTEAQRLRPLAEAGALIVSIAAGTSIASFQRACGARAKLIRAMPNLPGAIGKGISALYAPPKLSHADRALAESLLTPLGETAWVRREALIDVVTAVSGSGPGYLFLFVEALARAAEREGLPRALARKFARATLTGAGALLEFDARDAAELRRDVTSPGGTTEAALAILMYNDALIGLVECAVEAARKRGQELSG